MQGSKTPPPLYTVTVLIRDESDAEFWRKEGRGEPDTRIADYVKGLLDAGAPIAKFFVESIEIERTGA